MYVCASVIFSYSPWESYRIGDKDLRLLLLLSGSKQGDGMAVVEVVLALVTV